MNGHRKRIAVAGAIAVGVVGVAGTALGAGSSTAPSFMNDFARRLGVSPAKVKSAYQGAMADRLDQLVKEGKLTQAQADKLKARMKDGGMHGFGPGGFGGPGGPGFGGGRHHMFGGPGHPRGGPMMWLTPAAAYLGITSKELQTELHAGKTPAAIATAHGKTAEGLEQALVAAARKPLDAAVKAGKMTQAQATKIEGFLSKRIDDLVTNGFDHHGGWGGPPPPSGKKQGDSQSGGGTQGDSSGTASALEGSAAL